MSLQNLLVPFLNVVETGKKTLSLIKTRTRVRTAQKMKFSIINFFSKCDQILRKMRIWPYLLKKSLTENFIFLCSDDSKLYLYVTNRQRWRT